MVTIAVGDKTLGQVAVADTLKQELVAAIRGMYVRLDDRLCLLVIVGVTEHGDKELLAVEDGHRESEASWRELLTGLRERGLDHAPKLAVGDGQP